MEIGKRIKDARDLKNLTLEDIAIKVGVAKSTVQRYENGKIKTPKLPVLHSIANALGINPAWIEGNSNQIEPLSENKTITIPIFARIAAEPSVKTQEYIIGTEEIAEPAAGTNAFFGLQIHGDSMEPRILDGDVVIVRRQDEAESGDIVIVKYKGEDGFCTRLRKYHDGTELVPINPNFESGMSYEEVKSIMGAEGSVATDTDIAGIKATMYTWSSSKGFAMVSVMFQNGSVSSKSQYGLD